MRRGQLPPAESVGVLTRGFDALPAPIAVLDQRGAVLFVNEPWRRFAVENDYGDSECGVGENYLEICDAAEGEGADEAHRVAAGVRAVIAGEMNEFTFDYACPTPRAMHWFSMRASRFRSRGAVRVLVAHFEVTQLKVAELALRERETGLRVLVTQLPALVTTTDRNLRFMSAIGTGLQHLGLPLDQMIGRRLPDLVGEDADNSATVVAHRRAVSGEPVTFEAEWLGHCYQARVEPLRGSDGRVVGTVGVGVDISEIKRAQQERAQAAGRTKVLAEVSRAFIGARLDVQGIAETIVSLICQTMGDGCALSMLSDDRRTLRPVAVQHRDPEARALLQRLSDEASWPADAPIVAQVLGIGHPLRLWMPPEELRARVPAPYEIYLDRFPVHGASAVPLRIDERVIGLLAVWREGAEQEYTVDDEVLMQEIADRAGLAIANARLHSELEDRVQERTRQLEAANQELETFCYSVSHDLRAPLRSISGFSKALRDEYGNSLGADAAHLLARVLAGSRRMEELIDGLLLLSRTSRQEMYHQGVSLSGLAHEVGDELSRAYADRAVTFVVEPEVVAHGDARLLRVVMDNLLANAWKYTARHDAARIEFGVDRQNGEPVYFVRDDGAGFDMQYADKLFGPFQRLHLPSEFSGSGIGLATVQRIILRHGGQIWAHGEVERGATFSFTIPGRTGS